MIGNNENQETCNVLEVTPAQHNFANRIESNEGWEKSTLQFQMAPVKIFKIDWSKVQSLEDIKLILDKLDIAFFGEDIITGMEHFVYQVESPQV